ncbi:MAG TPA: hypothetical protein PKD68_04805 [Candidatus Saccharibacteria bacterium]|nr:hypothetical protein [Candidatus Saccharibacteria bacterium]
MNDGMSVLFLVGILVVAVGLIVMIHLTRRTPKGLNKEKYQEDWLKIEHLVGDDIVSQHMAIINADKLLDRALKERGFKGRTVGERMCAASREFTKRDAVWGAHKLRNKIAHEEDVKTNQQLTRRVLVSYKYALKDIGAL